MQLINLKTKFLGQTLNYYDQIDSTQKEIFRLIEQNNIKNGQLVIANIQTEGKGTHGRTWYTQNGNIAFSFYIETNCRPQDLEGITVKTAQILVEIFKEKYNISLDIKEPNDIVYNNKKIGGILTQSKINADICKYLVIGIGINTTETKFNQEIKDIATSIKKEFEIDVNNAEIISEFCNKFENVLPNPKI